MFSQVQIFRLVLITTSVNILTPKAKVQPPHDSGTPAEIHPEYIVCPDKPSYCACWMFKNSTYMIVQCLQILSAVPDFSMFNKTFIPSKLFLKCALNSISPITLIDGIFESLHAVVSIEIVDCHLMHISKQAFRGMSSLKNIIIQGGNDITMDKECLQIPDLANLETVTIIESGLTYAPVLCGREHLWLVNLTRNNLAIFSDTGLVCDTPTNVKIIDVSKNDLTDIPQRMSDVTEKLMVFLASNNRIHEIAPTIFENLTSVVVIDLSRNMILKIPADFLGFNSRMQTLKLAHNTVGLLPKGIFTLTPNITDIKFNSMNLDKDVWFQFKHLTMLRFLLLKNNNIQSFNKKVLSEMKELILLDLSDNNLPSISNRLFKSQSELKVLNLTRNRITFIDKDAFIGLQNLIRLDIQQNNIQSIHPNALVELSNLVQLNLSYNIIEILPTFPDSLQSLDLGQNEINYIDSKAFSGLTNAIGIGLAYNKITFIHQNAFECNMKLQILHLGHNNISYFHFKMLPPNSSLNTLLLNHNNISTFYAFPNEYFPSLRVLDISHNKLETLTSLVTFGSSKLFPESIEELYLAWNDIVFIDKFVFQLPSLRYVDLRDNKIMVLSNLALVASETNLFPVRYHLSGNSFICDCNLQWLKEAFTHQRNNSHVSIIIEDPDLLFCKIVYLHGPDLMKNIPTSSFLCAFVKHCFRTFCNCCKNVTCSCQTKCPEGCRCLRTRDGYGEATVLCKDTYLTSIPSDISTVYTKLFFIGNNFSYISSENFDGFTRVSFLSLTVCQIREIEEGSFKWLSNLLQLGLSYNFLHSLNAGMFEGLESLISLHVSFNQIQMIERDTFKYLKRLQYLDLTSNQLKRVSVHDFKKLSTLISLSISKNPWSCDCDYLEHMKNFTIANAGQIKDIHDVSCLFYNSTSNETVKYPLADVHLPDFCVNQTTFYNEGTTNLDTPTVVAMSTVLSLFVLGMIIFGVVFWNRQFLKVWCFVKVGWKWHQKETEDDALRPYDAFVSYSSDDEQFVIRELVPHLEENQNGRPDYRLCVHYRDFAVGASIAESIISAVEHSKRVIIILSENFLQSEWCQFEFQKAHLQLLEEKRNRIIIIMLHDINNQLLDKQLRDYIKTRTYVKYGDPWFWAKVRYAMPDLGPPACQNDNVIPNDHIQCQNIIDEGDLINDDTEPIFDDMRNHEVDDPDQGLHLLEMEIGQ